MSSFSITTVTSSAQALAGGELGYVSDTGSILGASVTMGTDTSLLNYGTIFNRSVPAVLVTSTLA